MDFASSSIHFDVNDEKEDIFVDDVEDGIASCAEQQAKLWVAAAVEEDRELRYIQVSTEHRAPDINLPGSCRVIKFA